MGCNAEQAKLKINEILTRNQNNSAENSVELTSRKADKFASLIDSEIKSKFKMNIPEIKTDNKKDNIQSVKKTPENDLDNVLNKNNDLLSFKNDKNIQNIISDDEFNNIKKNTIDMPNSEKRKLYIDALENSNDKKNGGGYSENIQEDRSGMKISEKDEDKKSGEFNKGYTISSAYSGIKKVKSSVLKTYKAVIEKSLDSTPGSKYTKKDSSVLLEIDNQIEDLAQNNPELAKEIFGDSFVNNQSEEDTFNILEYNRVKGSSMDSKYEKDPDEVLAHTMYLAEELEARSVPDSNSDYDVSMANISKIISDNLYKYGLDKSIEIYTHKLKKGDKKTRASYTFGEETAYQYEEDQLLEGGYKFEINGGRIDIYYGDGYYEEDQDGIIEREIRADVSLSTQKELIMHEILHSMIEKAAASDNKLERSLYLLKEQVMKQLSWKNFFKDEDAVKNASNAEIQLAKDIFEYMENPTEFLAYAATNENIFNAVQKIKISQELIGKFVPKRGQTIGKFKEFLNGIINSINVVYTALTTGASAQKELMNIITGLIDVNTKIEIKAINPGSKKFSKYEIFGISDKFKKTNDWLVNAEEGAFARMKSVWNAEGVRDKAEATGRFIESIGDWRHLQFIRDSRIISDTVTDIVEDTTTESVAWFYEAIRDIKGKREKDKIDFASVMKKKVGAEFKEFEKSERESVTFMLQGDWKALGVSIEEYKNMLQDDSIVRARVDELKKTINVNEYNNQAAMLGYYIVNGEAKGSAVMKNAYQIYYRYHNGKGSTGINNNFEADENIKMIDELASLYAILYTEKSIKDNIVKAIERDSDVVSYASDVYYSYRKKEESGQLGEFQKFLDKGYVRKSGQVDMKFDIIPESKIIKDSKIPGLNHKVIRERPDIQKMLNSEEKYYMVVERDIEPARTQGVLDDISVIETGQEINSFGAGKNLTYKEMLNLRSDRFKADKTYLNDPIDDSLESLRAMDNYSVADFDISGQLSAYSERISEADKVNYGRVNNDIADIIGNTTSHIQSKEKALLNNQRFIELLIEDSNNNIGAPGYVYLSAKSRDKELQKYWAMIPNYSRSQIVSESSTAGIWVKQSRLNNIIGYKDVSLSNLKMFGLKLEDYPKWQKAIQIVEYTWMELASSYKEIIVKLMPNVIMSNATSNMIVALRHGIGPLEYASAFKSAWSELSDYLDINEKKIALEIDKDVAKTNEQKLAIDKKIKLLDTRLKRNGFYSLINDGQFSMIFEDLDAELIGKSTHLKDVIMQKTEKNFGSKAAENLEEIRQNVYVTKDTRAHKAIEKLTLFNDIINKKIIEDKLLDDMKSINFASDAVKERYLQDTRNYLDQLFTNYSYLTNKYIKYASDMLILNFIKYFLRQGKAQLSMARRLPLGSAIAESIDTLVWNMPDPIDQYQNLFDTLGNKIGANPIDMLGTMMFPNILMPFRD